MSSLIQSLAARLAGSSVSEISNKIGAEEGATQNAMSAALPLLFGALARNASKPDGADALHRALSKDHDGTVLNDVDGFLRSPDTAAGDGILRHALGANRAAAEAGIGKAAGLDTQKTSQLMSMLAPLVMGALGQKQREQGLDASALTGMLDGARQESEGSGGIGKLIGGLLDRDGDGSVADDIAGKVLGGLFNRGGS